MMLGLILEGLQILDIATTEYSINKGIGEEENPLWKNQKKRRAMYPFKLASPIIIEIAGYYGKNKPIIKSLAMGSLLFLIGIQSIVGINNLSVILSQKNLLKRGGKEK